MSVYGCHSEKKLEKIVCKKIFNTINSEKWTILIFWMCFGLLSPKMAQNRSQNRSKYKIWILNIPGSQYKWLNIIFEDFRLFLTQPVIDSSTVQGWQIMPTTLLPLPRIFRPSYSPAMHSVQKWCDHSTVGDFH